MSTSIFSTKPCPKCGGQRCNDKDNKENYGRCYRCHARWFIISKDGSVN